VLVAAALAGVLLAAGCGHAPDELDARADRVLIVSLPGVSWRDVEDADLPHLRSFLRTSAIADMSTRIGRRPATLTDAYLSLGAGTRAVAPALDTALALDPGENYGGVPADQLVGRRLGPVPPGIAYLAVGPAVDLNEHSAFGADVGSLGDHLDGAGIARAVVANGDAAEGAPHGARPPEGVYARGAATMLMGSDGVVPGGVVGRSLLTDDPTAPYGHRLDRDRVLAAVDDTWGTGRRAVVLVEASDLARAAAYRPDADPGQRRAQHDRALADADALLGDLLERVDARHDAVLVLSPVAPAGQPALGVAALSAPGVRGGLLESATTRRAGYVQLADVAPTVLSLMGVGAPDDMEGRSFAVGDTTAGDRVGRLARAAEAAELRDATMAAATTAITTALVLLAVAVALRSRLPRGARRLLAPLAYAALGVVPASYLVGRIGPARTDLAVQVGAICLIAAGLAAVAVRVDRRRPGLGPIVAVGAIVALIGADVLVGGPLQLNTTFGYSVAVAGRFTGLGNLAFALFGSATVVLAALIVDRAGPRGLRPALALLAAVVLIEGLPMLGADVGGVVAMVPAFGVTGLVLAGRRVGAREIVALGAATLVVIAGLALIDAARPPEVQTHLARLASNVAHGRSGSITRNLGRRWQASLGGIVVAGWLAVVGVMAAAVGYAALGPGWIGALVRRRLADRPTRAAAAGLAVLAVLGLLANDSSFAVPSTMLIVIGPVVMLRVLAEPAAEPAPGDRPAPARVGEAVGA
jgi:hypothetical protein